MKWSIENTQLILENSTTTLLLGITQGGAICLQLGDRQEEKLFQPVTVNQKQMVPITVEEVGKDIIAAGNQITIRISPDLSISMKRQGEEFLKMPAGSIKKNNDTLLVRFGLSMDEQIYGLGQDPMAHLNQHGYERRMWNQWGGSSRCGNCGISFFMSSSGYGFLLDSTSDARFCFGKSEAPELNPLGEAMAPSLWNEAEGLSEEEGRLELHDNCADIYILPGRSYREILKLYYELTGFPGPLPKWAYGFLQSKNRYMNQEDILRTGRTYRDKRLPCDALIIDWLWFQEMGDLEWRMDDWPDAVGMFKELERLGFHAASAQHPFISEQSKHYSDYKNHNYLNLVPESKRITYDQSNPKAREFWWQKVKKLYEQGLRGYWIDMGELEEHFEDTVSFGGSRTRIHNAYSLLWSRGLYEGQRGDYHTRPFILARSGCAGIHRYGTAIWSGDIDSSWKVLSDQVVVGQGMAMSGITNWATDIGGFLSGKEFSPELFIRWMEWGAFCTVFRAHGTRPENEPWSYGSEEEKLLRNIIELRYRLLPYTYSQILSSAITGEPVIRPMAYQFGKDKTACGCVDQYMYGPEILVAPITSPGSMSRKVYLPEGEWYDFHNNRKLPVGWHEIYAPLGKMPIFIRAGSIIPAFKDIGVCIEQCSGLELIIFPGEDAEFDFYDDDGLSFAYENGDYTHIHFSYRDRSRAISSQVIKGMAPSYDIIFYQGEADYRKHSAMCSWSCSNKVTIQMTSDCDYQGEVNLMMEKGWRLQSCSEAGYDNRDMFVPMMNHTWSKEVDKLRCEPVIWEYVYTGSHIPVREQKGQLKLVQGDKVQNLSLCFGTTYIQGFELAGCFNLAEEDNINTVFEPEIHTSLPFYLHGESCIYWERDMEYSDNCFGYVDFRRLNPEKNGEEISGAAYAKVNLYTEKEVDAEILLRHDSPIKLWVNHEEIYVSEAENRRIKLLLKLRSGDNQILVKQVAKVPRPYSGGEFGFSMKYIGEADLWRKL